MSVIRSHQTYFEIVKDFNQASSWQKSMLIRGTLLSQCTDIEPVSIRLKLQAFWQKQATLLGLDLKQLQTWS
jgi:hypothetical protein